jgi:hypothetical protein
MLISYVVKKKKKNARARAARARAAAAARWLLHAAAGSILAHVIITRMLADSRIAQPDLANGTQFQVLMKDRF